ncbi:MAG TPA: DUF4908 domain-containing protein [Rhizomicrobium sp.]|nr:DUF4908 domain-containing protein [Rhizomicrobium sp.]
MSARLSKERVGDVDTGTYAAGETNFTLDRYADKFLLRISGDPEVYVLYPDRASLGGRVLKYDSGKIALRVAGWGGMTLYTDEQSGGVPAERTGDSLPPSLAPISLSDMQGAAEDEAAHLAYSHRVHLNFTADWAALAGDSRLRALCFDALQNTARGIARFATNDKARAAFAKKIDQVRLALGTKPIMYLSGRTLNVVFNAQTGYIGRASSRGIARALGQLLSVPAPN